MTWYRALKRLSTGHAPGELISATRLAEHAIAPLLERGAIAPVAFPPLVALGGWTLRAATLAAVGLADVGALLDADADKVADALGLDAVEVAAWQAEAAAAMVVTQCQSGKCRRK
jgi:hypothetical protein